ncbi:MAG: hypothetical protein ABSD52_06195 [Candidatus Cybelea sp.]
MLEGGQGAAARRAHPQSGTLDAPSRAIGSVTYDDIALTTMIA